MQVRTLRVGRGSDVSPEYSGAFTTIYYLEGDERAAVQRFVDENREQLEAIDFSNPDALQSALDRELYDWILHELGEREIRKYHTVVYEQRSSGVEWVVDREQYEIYPNRRYTTGESSVKVGPTTTTEEVYEDLDETISETDLAEHDAVEGREIMLLEYYRLAGPFDCEAATDSEYPAIRKHG